MSVDRLPSSQVARVLPGTCGLHLRRRKTRGPRHQSRHQMMLLLLLFNVLLLLPATTGLAAPAQRQLTIVAYGDSLTAGYGLRPEDSFPSQLERALRARGHDVKILNAGVSGDTTSGGLERFDWAIPEAVDAVILELGANDALRGLDPVLARRNLEAIVARLKARKIEVLLAGMQAPRNLGPDYVKAFDTMYPDLARKHGLLLYPFFLDGVATRPDLNLADGLHPNAKGIAEIVKRILPATETLISRVRSRLAGERG
ncbi:MAG: arylesterase [Hyphomicrobiaceae bacterium]